MNLPFLIVFISTFLIGLICALYLRKLPLRKHVFIVILGDVGRSPRMQYHARSFAREGFKVDLIGYPGSTPLKELQNNANVNIHYLVEPKDLKHMFNTMVVYVLKVLHQTYQLFRMFIRNPRPSYLMLQNPPAIPTIPICWIYCCIMRVKLIIDWHNYAFTIMGLNLGEDHPMVKISMLIEMYIGGKANKNFCVTEALKNDLNIWDIKSSVLYDRPPDDFKSINLDEKHDLLMKLKEEHKIFAGTDEESTVFTQKKNDKVMLLEKRPGFIVSSTSWTEDEDFSVLVKALGDYESACCEENSNYPDLICVITGKGPLKEFYLRIIERRKWKHVKVITPWLETEDYPKLLASADLGVCLHKSSSGLDLPMKVVDMFGCGLPVLAHDFNCLSELVKHNENGMIFSNENELSDQLKSWFVNFPNNPDQIRKTETLKTELKNFQRQRWHDNWKSQVLPYFSDAQCLK